MSKIAALLAAVVLAAAAAAPASPADMAKPTGQQSKMKSCNAEAGAKGLKGDARKGFMSGCLKGGSAGSTAAAASPRMQQCTAQAEQRKLAGAAKTSFMKKCEATG